MYLVCMPCATSDQPFFSLPFSHISSPALPASPALSASLLSLNSKVSPINSTGLVMYPFILPPVKFGSSSGIFNNKL